LSEDDRSCIYSRQMKGRKLAFKPGFSRYVFNIYFIIVVFIIVSALLKPSFVAPRHLINIARQAAPLGIVSIGQTLVILLGGLDLSVGSVITLTNVLMGAISLGRTEMTLQVVVLCLALGWGIGLTNGVFVAKLRVDPFIMTLAMMLIIKGVSWVYVGGAPKGFTPPPIRYLATGWIGGVVPLAVITWLILAGIAILVLHRTVYGWWVYAIGGNKQAAYLSGARIDLTTLITYGVCGAGAVVAGLLASGNIGATSLTLGEEYMLNSLAAVVIGGTNFGGGRGGIAGSIAGSLLLLMIFSILTMLNVGYAGRLITRGTILAGAVAFYTKRAT